MFVILDKVKMEMEDLTGGTRGARRKKALSFREPVTTTLMRNNSRPAWKKSTRAFISGVTCWRSEGLVKLSQGGGILTVYGLILGHVIRKDFAQLRDEEALEFLSAIKTDRKSETSINKDMSAPFPDRVSSKHR